MAILNNHNTTDNAKQVGNQGSDDLALHETDQSSGSLVLGGRDKANNAIIYRTKYRVDHQSYRKGPCTEALHKILVPCCDPQNLTSSVDFLTGFLKSEAFFVTLQLTALSLGVTKEALDMRHLHPKLHFVLTVFETVVCVAVVLLRVFAMYVSYKDMQDDFLKLEYSENQKSSYIKTVRCSSVCFTLLSILLISLAISGVVMLHMYVHLGWTILTNNSVLLLNEILYRTVDVKHKILFNRVQLDHHKLALEESLLLVKEGLCYRGYVNKEYVRRCREFIVALDNTPEFVRPVYIVIDEHEDLTMCETVSTI